MYHIDYVLFKGSCFGSCPFQMNSKTATTTTTAAVDGNQGQDSISVKRRYNTRGSASLQAVVDTNDEQLGGGRGGRGSHSADGCCTDSSKSVYLIGTTPAQGDKSLYPSDHYGIVANFVLQQ